MPPKQETTVPKNKAKAKAKIPSTEKYDWSRTQGIDPRIPEWVEQMGDMDELRGVWRPPDVHTGLGPGVLME